MTRFYSLARVVLLIVQKSHSQPPGMVLKPCKKWDFNYLSLNWFSRRISAINSIRPMSELSAMCRQKRKRRMPFTKPPLMLCTTRRRPLMIVCRVSFRHIHVKPEVMVETIVVFQLPGFLSMLFGLFFSWASSFGDIHVALRTFT